jgi:hypothetical protein
MLKNALGKNSGIVVFACYIRDCGIKNAECGNADFFLEIKSVFIRDKDRRAFLVITVWVRPYRDIK